MAWALASNIAERIRDLRRTLALDPDSQVSQRELARRAGVRASQVSQWERGAQQPSRSRLERWAEREGWPVTIFAEGEPMPSDLLRGTGAEPREGVGSGEPSSGERPAEPLPPQRILARFYELMADAARRGTPYPPEFATLMDEMYRVATGLRPPASGKDAGVGGPVEPEPTGASRPRRKKVTGW